MSQKGALVVKLKEFSLKQKRHYVTILILLFVFLLALSYLMLTVGNTNYTLREVLQAIQSGSTGGIGYTVNRLRVPKLLVGGMAGFALGVSGYVFQTLLRNPLASPDMIGITAGSSAAAVFAILILQISGPIVSIISIIGGLLVTALIFVLSGKHSEEANSKMILIGIGVQAILNSLISWMLLVGSEYDVATALRWLRGSLNGVQMRHVLPTAGIVVFAMIGLLVLRKPFLMMQLGEDYPVTLGVDTKKVRIQAMLMALLLSAAAAGVTGSIASVAFLSAPVAQRLIGRSKDAMVASGLVGVILVYASELIGQNAFSARYPAGVITGVLGAPYLLILLTKMNKKESR